MCWWAGFPTLHLYVKSRRGKIPLTVWFLLATIQLTPALPHCHQHVTPIESVRHGEETKRGGPETGMGFLRGYASSCGSPPL